MTFNTTILKWNYPTDIRVGANSSKDIAHLCHEINIKRPLLVTDPGLSELPLIQNMLQDALQAGLKASLFFKIKANPTEENVTDGINAYHDGRHDGIVAVGGGSAMDVGKAIALMIGQTKPLFAFEDVGDNWKSANKATIAPVIAIPTTAGTGSEVGRASVITDTATHTKKIIFHPNMLPKLVLLDPLLTLNLPKSLTAATGMDALSHNLEAYCAPGFHPLAEGIALRGIKLIKRHLITAYQQGEDITARTNMLVASMMGATAFQRGLGAMHALAHPLGAHYDAHHGRLNAILMPYVLVANRERIEAPIIALSRYLNIDGGFRGFMDWIVQLRQEIGIEHTLKAIGIGEEKLAIIAERAESDAAGLTNPIRFDKAQYQQILYQAIHGQLDY